MCPQNLYQNFLEIGKWEENESLALHLLNLNEKNKADIMMSNLSCDEEKRYRDLLKLFSSSTLSIEDKKLYAQELLPYYQDDYSREPYLPKIRFKPFNRNCLDKNSLSKSEANLYNKLGFVGPFKLSNKSKKLIRHLSNDFSSKANNKGTFLLGTQWNTETALDLAMDDGILTKVSSILGNELVLTEAAVHNIAPDTPVLGIHSDINGLSALTKKKVTIDEDLDNDFNMVSVWISFTDIHKNNAPLSFFPGTHRWNIITPSANLNLNRLCGVNLEYFCKLFSLNDSVKRRALLLNEYLVSTITNVELSNTNRTTVYANAGEYIIFNAHTLHSVTKNISNLPRTAISLRYRCATNKPTLHTNYTYIESNFSTNERDLLNILDPNKEPTIQILGNKYHKDYCPINIGTLRKLIKERMG